MYLLTFSVPLYHASGHNQLFALATFFVSRHFQHGVYGFLGCTLQETARVDHDHIRVIWLLDKFKIVRYQFANHNLAVDAVFWASQAYAKHLFAHDTYYKPSMTFTPAGTSKTNMLSANSGLRRT